MQKSDRIAAVFFLALSLFICQQSTVIGVGGLHRPGPGLMSFGAGMGIGVLALAVLVLSFFLKTGPAELDRGKDTGRKAKILLICSSLFAYAVAVVWLGFVLATFAFVFFLLRVVQSERWWISAVKAALITLGNYGLFVAWLGIKLPQGVLPW